MRIRPFNGRVDIACVFNTWCNHIRRSPPFDRMDPEEFRRHKRTVLEALVARDETIVACHEDHEDQIFGYLCGYPERNVVHFVFVKEWARRRAIATALLKSMFPWFGKRKIYYTHQTKASKYLEPKWMMQYNPYLVKKCEESLL